MTFFRNFSYRARIFFIIYFGVLKKFKSINHRGHKGFHKDHKVPNAIGMNHITLAFECFVVNLDFFNSICHILVSPPYILIMVLILRHGVFYHLSLFPEDSQTGHV
jgi:hypothetical protein